MDAELRLRLRKEVYDYIELDLDDLEAPAVRLTPSKELIDETSESETDQTPFEELYAYAKAWIADHVPAIKLGEIRFEYNMLHEVYEIDIEASFR